MTLRGGEQRKLALSSKQNRWELLSDTLAVLRWEIIEALDDKGVVLGAVEREGDYEYEDAGDDVDRVKALTQIVVNAIQSTMQESRKMFADQLTATSALVKEMVDAMHVIRESYALAMKVQATAGVGEEDNDEVMKMLQMAWAMKNGGMPSMNAKPPTQARVTRPTPPRDVNGKAKDNP